MPLELRNASLRSAACSFTRWKTSRFQRSFSAFKLAIAPLFLERSLDHRQPGVLFDGGTLLCGQLDDFPGLGALQLVFHLHRLDNDEPLSLADLVAERHHYPYDFARHRSRHHLAAFDFELRGQPAKAKPLLAGHVDQEWLAAQVDGDLVAFLLVVQAVRSLADHHRSRAGTDWCPVDLVPLTVDRHHVPMVFSPLNLRDDLFSASGGVVAHLRPPFRGAAGGGAWTPAARERERPRHRCAQTRPRAVDPADEPPGRLPSPPAAAALRRPFRARRRALAQAGRCHRRLRQKLGGEGSSEGRRCWWSARSRRTGLGRTPNGRLPPSGRAPRRTAC